MIECELKPLGEGRFTLSGTLDFESVPALLERSESLFDDWAEVSIDLASITRSNSAGLALLLEWMRLAQSRGKSVHYLNLPQPLLQIAKISGLEEILSLGPPEGFPSDAQAGVQA